MLVVIGLLMGMAFKGKSLVDAARIKADMQKINKISTAVNVYYSKYDRLPGMRRAAPADPVMTIRPADFYDDLLKEGAILEKDFLQTLVGKTFLSIVGCQEALDVTNQRWQAVAASEQTSLCITPYSSHPKDTTLSAVDFAAEARQNFFSSYTICQIEMLLDDKSLDAGDARLLLGGRRALPAALDRNEFDCSQYINLNPEQSNATFLIRIF